MGHEIHKNSVLVVDDEKANLQSLNLILSEDYTVYTVNNGQDAIKLIKKHPPDIIILDILMPDMDGYEVFKEIKNNGDTRSIPIIFITALDNPKDEERGLAMGAADYITKPFNPTIVKLRVKNQVQIINHIETIRQLNSMDQLTRIANRQSFDYRLHLEWERSKRDRLPLSLLLFDIDNFKKYNDSYGHLQGDTALKVTAKVAQQSLHRSIDFIGRWGGEEFVVLLSDTDSDGAMLVAETIRENIEKAGVPCHDGETTNITVSIGVNTHTPALEEKPIDFFNGADKALYEAKNSGKNKVVNTKNQFN